MNVLERLDKECDWLDINLYIANAKVKYWHSVWFAIGKDYTDTTFVPIHVIGTKRRKYYDTKAAAELWSMFCSQKVWKFLERSDCRTLDL